MFKINDRAVLKRTAIASLFGVAALSAGSVMAADNAPWKDAQHVYEKVCGHCHDAEVGVGPVLTGRQLPAAYTVAIVRHGFRAMPSFPASYIDDASLQKVGEYIAQSPATAE